MDILEQFSQSTSLDKDFMPSLDELTFKRKVPEIIIYHGVVWSGCNWQAQLRVGNRVIKSKEHFGSQLEAGQEWVRMVKEYRGDTLKVDSHGARRKSPYLFLTDEEIRDLIDASRKELSQAT